MINQGKLINISVREFKLFHFPKSDLTRVEGTEYHFTGKWSNKFGTACKCYKHETGMQTRLNCAICLPRYSVKFKWSSNKLIMNFRNRTLPSSVPPLTSQGS